MRKRILAIVLVIALLLANLPAISAAETAADSQTAGTADDPHLISSAAEWTAFLENANSSSDSAVYYRLTADIQADEEHSTLGGYTASHIVLDGDGHTVSGFQISGAIFAKLTASTIRYVNFSDLTVTNSGGSAAVLSLETAEDSRIIGCRFDGCTLNKSDSTVEKAAVITAVNHGMILNCTVADSCIIKASAEMAGGLAAENSQTGILCNNISQADIPYAGVVGTLVGSNAGILQRCYARLSNGLTACGSNTEDGSILSCLIWENGLFSMTDNSIACSGMDIRQLAAEMSQGTQNDNNGLDVTDTEEYGCLWAVEGDDLALSLDGKTAQIYLYADETLATAQFSFTDREALTIPVSMGQKFSVRVGYYLNGAFCSNQLTVSYQMDQSYTMVNSFVYSPNQDYVEKLVNCIDGENKATYSDVYLSATLDRQTGTSQASSVLYPYCATLSLSNQKTADEIVAYRFAGSGTPDDPYQISSAYELQCLSSHVSNGLSYNGLRFNEASYILTRDVDLSGIEFEPIGIYSRDYSLAFRGSFDGQGYQISGLSMYRTQIYCGLFGITAGRSTEDGVENAQIRNLNVSGLSIGTKTAYTDLVGGIVGMAVYTTLDGCVVQGSITAGTQAGGIAGYAYRCQLQNCGTNVSVTTLSYYAWSGGIAGYSAYSTIENSYSACTFTNENVIIQEYLHTGAIAGYIKKTTFQNCFYLPCDAVNVGRRTEGIQKTTASELQSEAFLLQLQDYSEQRCFHSVWEAGGSQNWNGSLPVVQLSKDHTYRVTCQVTTAGSVSCVETATGAAVEQAQYPSGRTVIITTTTPDLQGLTLVDANTQPLDIPVTREGTYTFSFPMPEQAVWVIPDFGISALCGHGTEEDPYWIYSKAGLTVMAELIGSGANCPADCTPYVSAHYRLIRDVDLYGEAIPSIPIFSGTFDGGGHTLSNVRLQGVQTALFCRLEDATVQNLVLKTVSIEGRESAIVAQTAAGSTVLTNIMVLGAEGGGLICQADGTLTVVNVMLEDLALPGSTDGWILAKTGSSSIVLKNILLSGSDPSTIVSIGSTDNVKSLTQEQLLLCQTGQATWQTIAQLGSYAAAELADYGACLWTAADLEKPDAALPRLCFDSVGAISTITCDAVFSTSLVKLFEVSEVPSTAAAGQIVEIPCYLNASTGNLKILDSNGTELGFTVDIHGQTEDMGIIRFEMPTDPVTITNNGQSVKKLYLKGKGTPSAPFEIWTPADLLLMADVISQRQLQYISDEDYVDYSNGYFRLMADLDMEGIVWEGIGTELYTFFGTLDGNGHTIRNLNVNNGLGETQRLGLFLSIGQGGTVRDLTLASAIVFPGGNMNASGVIAHVNKGTIARCVVTDSSVSLGNYAYLGGIAGKNDTTGVIVNCAVRNTSLIRRHGGTSTKAIGGITQANNGLVLCCYTYGCTFTNGTAENGSILSSGNAPVNCYYDSTTANAAAAGGTPATRDEFFSGQVTYLLQTPRSGNIWGQNIDNGQPNPGYPVLLGATVYAVGNCTAITGYSNTDHNGGHSFSDNGFCIHCDAYQSATDVDNDGVYEIANAGQLYWFASLVNRGYTTADAILTKDIRINLDEDEALRQWILIGTQERSFLGHFDGQGYSISYLYLTEGDHTAIGLFGAIGPDGLVERVSIEGYFYTAPYAGGIAGINQGTIRNCCSLSSCYSTGSAGGIAGLNEGTILYCYSYTKLYLPIAGESKGTVKNSYYLSKTENGSGGMTTDQFVSGEIAYLLQAPQTEAVWGQNIDNGLPNPGYPVLLGATVYDISVCVEEKYSNTDSNRELHDYQNGFCSYCDAYQSATDVDGDGVYEVSNGGQLFWFAAVVNGGYGDTAQNTAAQAILTANINLENRAWDPIGTQDDPFAGYLDGQRHTVSSLTCCDSPTDYRGLFGCVGQSGTVENLGLADSVVEGRSYVGGIAGHNLGLIQKCFHTASVSGGDYVGGIAGMNEGLISNCYHAGSLAGQDLLGGITGQNGTYGTISHCHNASYGGIAGENLGTVENCYYLSDSEDSMGGMTADQFASGEVAYLLQKPQAEAVWGQTVEQEEYPVFYGKTVYQGGPCQAPQYLNSPFAVTHTYRNGFCVYCDAYQSAKLVSGRYEITNGGQMFWFAAVVNGGYENTAQNTAANAVLTANIDLEKRGWTPIGVGNVSYFGRFDGQGYCITGLYLDNATLDYAGLFGTIGTGGNVRMLEIADLSIQGGDHSGGIAGMNHGSIVYCAARGSLLGGTGSGGIVGENAGQIFSCYTTACAAVSGNNTGTAAGCYYLAGTENASGGMTVDQFASGEVAYRMQQPLTESIWGQNIDNGQPNPGYPVLLGATVYAVGNCTAITGYSNTDRSGGHSFSDNGFCIYCDAYQNATDVDNDGVYEIANAGQLYWFASLVNSGYTTADAILTKDIRINLDEDEALRQWILIGTQERSFLGHFDGQGHSISYLYLTEGDHTATGLFGAIGSEGLVERVSIEGDFSTAPYAGGIAGINQGTIRNCCSLASCSSTGSAGGIAGLNEGNILHCYSYTQLYLPTAGENKGTVQNCYYLSDTENGSGGMTADQFASGEIAYLLQAPQANPIWGQKIGTDQSPVFYGDTVYRGGLCNREYSNFPAAVYHLYDNGFCTLCDAYEPAPDTDGDGYYEISNGGMLYWFAERVNSGKTYSNAILTNDVWVNESVAEGLEDTLRDWLVIGSDELPYSGVFNGRGHRISGLYCSVTKYSFKDPEQTVTDWKPIGLFGSVSKGGTVMNVTLNKSYFYSVAYVGGIVGTNFGKILNCTNLSPIEGDFAYAGGIAGTNDGSITNCTNYGIILCALYTGGIAGSHALGSILNCTNFGTVTGTSGSWLTGGIAGESQSTISDCVNHGTISNSGWYAGGIVGLNSPQATVKNSVSFGQISGKYAAGGIAGDNNGLISNCYHDGSVSSQDYGSGGIAGSCDGKVEHCYNIGTVTSSAGYAGAIVGNDMDGVIVDGRHCTISNCYYLPGCATDGSGTVQNGVGQHGTGSTTADVSGETEARTLAQFISGEVAYLLQAPQTDLIWGQNIDNGEPLQSYPVFYGARVYFATACTTKYSNYPESGGHFFSDNGFCIYCDAYQNATDVNGDGVYEIANGGQLFWFAAVVNGDYDGTAQNPAARAILTADINLENRAWTPIGSQTTPFVGHLNGQRHTVSSLNCDSSADYLGLFGCVGQSGTVENLGLTDSVVKGSNYVGGIAGHNLGLIKKCFHTASVSGGDYVGGIAGMNEGEISNCYHAGSLSGKNMVGGITGQNDTYSTISHCHNASSGGIAGENLGKLKNCYYLSNTEDGTDSATADASGEIEAKTLTQFLSGEVAYLLQKPQAETVWGQEIDSGLPNPGYPELWATTVYPVGNCIQITGYSNTASELTHVFGEDEFCDLCDYPWAVLSYYSLSLSGNIGLNFYMRLSDTVLADESAYMQFTMADGQIIQIPVSQGIQSIRGGKTYYVFSCEVAAKEMTDLVTCQFFHSKGSTEPRSYSIQGYANYIISTPGYPQELRELVIAMLHYGAAAQLHFGYNTDNLANAQLDAPDYSGVTIDGFEPISGQGTDLAKLVSISLLLETETTLRFFFQVDSSVSALTVTYNGQELPVKQRSGLYYVDVTDISAKSLDENVTISLNDGSQTVSVTYNPMTYCRNVWSDTSGTYPEEHKTVTAALYLYNQAANAYFAL